MREIRLTLYFLIGFLLAAIACTANAALLWGGGGGNGQRFGSVPLAVCTAIWGPGTERADLSDGKYYCLVNGAFMNGYPLSQGQACIDTDPGAGVPCECTAPAVRDPVTGMCGAPACASAPNAQLGTQRYGFPYPQPSGVTYCVNGCEAYPGGVGTVVGNIRYANAYVNGPGGAGSSCTGTAMTPNPVPNPTSETSPPCAPGDGVLESASGVKCVPASTVAATVPPVVSKSQSTETKPDGSQVITNTTNTCTGAGACTTTTTTTVTNNTAGQPGQAGTPGTSTKVADKPSEQPSDFCAKNPNLQMCKGGMNEEATQKQVLAEVKKLTTPDASDDSALQSATHSAASQTALEAEDKKFSDAGGGIVDPTSGNKSAWSLAMSTGWFDPVPSSTCVPLGGSFAGRSFTFDHCPVAAKISEWGAWACWFGLVVSTFFMLTGHRGEA